MGRMQLRHLWVNPIWVQPRQIFIQKDPVDRLFTAKRIPEQIEQQMQLQSRASLPAEGIKSGRGRGLQGGGSVKRPKGEDFGRLGRETAD
jgi:hypothetical protein